MKKITEMYDDEIAALTEEQLDMLIKVECMEQGVPLEPSVPDQTFFELPKTNSAYQVKGTEFWLEDRGDAARLAKLLSEMASKLRVKKYDWRTGYDVEWLENYETEIRIDEHLFYDKMQVQDKEQFLVKRKALKEEYEKDKKKYDESRDKVRKVSDSIYSVFYSARKDQDKKNRLKKTFDEYVQMSGGDRQKARMFFDKAYAKDIDTDMYSEIFDGEKPFEYLEVLVEKEQNENQNS